MLISETIVMLEKAKAKYGDIPVWIDMDYGRCRELEEDGDPLCPTPQYEKHTKDLPERIEL